MDWRGKKFIREFLNCNTEKRGERKSIKILMMRKEDEEKEKRRRAEVKRNSLKDYGDDNLSNSED
jgi:hypothetical protein